KKPGHLAFRRGALASQAHRVPGSNSLEPPEIVQIARVARAIQATTTEEPEVPGGIQPTRRGRAGAGCIPGSAGTLRAVLPVGIGGHSSADPGPLPRRGAEGPQIVERADACRTARSGCGIVSQTTEQPDEPR